VTGDPLAIKMAATKALQSVNFGFGVTMVESEYMHNKDYASIHPDGRSLYDLVDIKHHMTFVSEPSKPIVQHIPKEKNSNPADPLDISYRSGSRFTIYVAENPIESSAKTEAWDLGTRILARLQHENGTPMGLAETVVFMHRMGAEIEDFYHKLLLSDAQFHFDHVPVPKTPSNPKIKVKTHYDHVPWHSFLAGVKFSGLQNKGKAEQNAATMKFTASAPPQPSIKGMKKRNVQNNPVGHAAALHHVVGISNAMQGFNLIAPYQNGNTKRSEDPTYQSGWHVDKQNDVYTVALDNTYFRNEIDHPECGIPNYTGDQSKNLESCHTVRPSLYPICMFVLRSLLTFYLQHLDSR
jgi:hypothetical protein